MSGLIVEAVWLGMTQPEQSPHAHGGPVDPQNNEADRPPFYVLDIGKPWSVPYYSYYSRRTTERACLHIGAGAVTHVAVTGPKHAALEGD